MKKRNINIDRKNPSSSEIGKHKDFDKLLSDFQGIQAIAQAGTSASGGAVIGGKSILSAGWLTGIFGGIVLLVISSVVLLGDEKEVNPISESEIQVPEINSAPLNVMDFQLTQTREEGKDLIFEFEGGVKLLIPDLYLKDIQIGDQLTCEVYSSTLPNNLKALEEKNHYQFTHVKAGESKLYVPTHLKLQVMDSTKVFQLTNDNTWLNVGEKVTKVVARKPLPIKPKKADPNKYIFDLEVDPNDFPELASYQGYIFQIEDTKNEFKKEYYDLVWSDVKLKRIKDEEYKMTLISDTQTLIFDVTPVLRGKKYDQALAKFNSELKWIKENSKEVKDDDFELENVKMIAI
jgi:hypothetical protein